MLTAAVRDLHAAHPGQFQSDVRTSADAIWENNPHITPLKENEPGVETLDVHYPLIHQSNQRPYHFIHGYTQYLEEQLGLTIPATKFHGDVYLTDRERETPGILEELGVPEGFPFWIIVAGGKHDFTAKWWNPQSFQKVVDRFKGRIHFAQCGEAGHWHPPLDGVRNLVGKTTLRQFMRLVYHAAGVVCPVTLAMHLAAAVETRDGRKGARPCVVVAGGREPAHWEAYPNHQFISTNGALPCCAEGGCWKSRCQLVGDGDPKDSHNVCHMPVHVREDLRIAKCMEMIEPEDVIGRVELYYRGGALQYKVNARETMRTKSIQSNKDAQPTGRKQPNKNVVIKFRHGLGDAVQLTSVLRHLDHYHPDWHIEVASLVGKHSAFHGLCDEVSILDGQPPRTERIDTEYNLDWHECATCYSDSPSTKADRCLREVFELTPMEKLCRYVIKPSEAAIEKAHRYLRQVCKVSLGSDSRYPVVLIHYEGNTSSERKNLPHEVARSVCAHVIRAGCVPVILDWDHRSPLPDGVRIHNPHVDLELWDGMGTGDAAVLAALTELSTLMIGVDSGPLHVAGATSTPTIGVWTAHHPLHYMALAENMTHLVPENHRELLRGNRVLGGAYFREHYRYQTYDDLEEAMLAAVEERLKATTGALVFTRNYWIRNDNAEQDLVVVKDIAEDDSYHITELPMPRPVVVDVGAHIGCFSKKIHERNPLAQIIAVECCPENIPALKKNIGGFATVIQAAVTYEKEVALLNAVYRNCVTTGGSVVLPRSALEQRVGNDELQEQPTKVADQPYWADFRRVTSLTVEDILQSNGLDHIDILKLDCEGSEFSILENTASLDRIGLIVGEYHGRERFLKLVASRFSDWKLRILKDGELGTFWLQRPVDERTAATRRLAAAPASKRDSGTPETATWDVPWIYLCTPRHTGTHFVRLLLELHPKISFWKCGRTQVGGRSMKEWQELHRAGAITFRKLLRVGVRCAEDLPEWSRKEARELYIEIPEKHVEYELVHSHATGMTHWYPSLPTIVTIRDPLLAVISALRRGEPDLPEDIIAGIRNVADKDGECFYFCVDLWEGQRDLALRLFSHLGLTATQEIHQYLSLWRTQNSAELHEHLILDKSEELAEARRWAMERKGVHPAVASWVEKIREARLQSFYERLGYRDLVWFE